MSKNLRALLDAEFLVRALERDESAGGFVEWKPLKEARASRIFTHIKSGKAWAVLTAWKSDLSGEENRKRLKSFLADLRRFNFGAIPIRGVGQEGDKISYEVSFFIPKPEDMDDEKFHLTIEKLARKYDQWGYVIYAPEKSNYILLYGDGPPFYRAVDRWNYVSFTPKEFIDVYYSLKHGTAFQFQHTAQRQNRGLKKHDKRAKVYEGDVRRVFNVIEGMAGSKSSRVRRYHEIIRPFFTAGVET